jgi:hypothetical protein
MVNAIIGARPIQQRRRPIVGVNVGRGETRWDPREAMNAGPWGGVGGAEAEKIK